MSELDDLRAEVSRLKAIGFRVTKLYQGFELESMNGVVCSIPDGGLDAKPHRTWCVRCQGRYRELKSLGAEISGLAGEFEAEVSRLQTEREEAIERCNGEYQANVALMNAFNELQTKLHAIRAQQRQDFDRAEKAEAQLHDALTAHAQLEQQITELVEQWRRARTGFGIMGHASHHERCANELAALLQAPAHQEDEEKKETKPLTRAGETASPTIAPVPQPPTR